MPGVLAVITGDDLRQGRLKSFGVELPFRRPDGSPLASPPRPMLAVGTVRFAGEAIAAVIADSVDDARDAAEAIEVEYDTLPAVVELGSAAAEGSPQIWPAATGNVVAQARYGDAAVAQAAFDKAAHVVSLDLGQSAAGAGLDGATQRARRLRRRDRPHHLAVEHPDAVERARRAGRRGSSAFRARKVRVLVGDVGGGFGMKTGLYSEEAVTAFASRALKRPVKWAAERIDDFLSATHGRDTESTVELALDVDGKVLALRVRTLANMGAYPGNAGVAIQLLIGPWVSTSIYDITTVDFEFTALLTNTTPTGPYRGAGRPEAIYIIERLMDTAARKMGLDPAELRRRNHDQARADALPRTRWARSMTAASSRRC